MDEAIVMLQERGNRLDMLRVRAFPFHQDVPDFIAEHEFVFLVEQNRDAQLRSLIVNECGIDPIRIMPILHYDGTPITASFPLPVTTSASSREEAYLPLPADCPHPRV